MPCDEITSLTNFRVKQVVELRHRPGQRRQHGLTIVEGVREATRALQAGVTFKELYVCNELMRGSTDAHSVIKQLKARNVAVYETTQAVFSKISYGDRSEGLLAVCAPKRLAFSDFPLTKFPLFVVVEQVEKPGNLGAILRTCDGVGVDGVIVCEEKTDLFNPNVIRASLGTVFSVKTVVSSNAETFEFLKKKNIQVCATLPQARMAYTKADLTKALAVIVGSEQNGLTDFWVGRADLNVRIPMRGRADSLNVSVSTAVLLYEAIRQRTR